MNEQIKDYWHREHGFRLDDPVFHEEKLGHVCELMGDTFLRVRFKHSASESSYLDYREVRPAELCYYSGTLNREEARILYYLDKCYDCRWVCGLAYDLDLLECHGRIPSVRRAKSAFEKRGSRLLELGLVREVRDSDGAENYFQITGWGKDAVRSACCSRI